MNNYKLALLIVKNRAKLERLITEQADYDKILKQSKKLDKYIAKKIIKDKKQAPNQKNSYSS